MSLNGLLLVDKPAGMTSHDVVNVARKKLKTKSIGHAGTLDPFATGLLILVVGEGTKISDFLRDGDKRYLTTIKLGVETDTLDLTGEVLQEKPVSCTKQDIEEAVLSASGDLTLQIPKFSAVKVDGKKLYEKARKHEDFKPPEKVMSFYNVNLVEVGSDTAMAEVSCKKGGYIRAWGNHIGKKLDCGAHLTQLKRLSSSGYNLKQALSFECLENISEPDEILSLNGFVPIEGCLSSWPTIMVKGRDETLLGNGQISFSVNNRLVPLQKKAQACNEIIGIRVLSGESDKLLCILEARPDKKLKIRRNFKL